METEKFGKPEERVNGAHPGHTDGPYRILMVEADHNLGQSNADKLRQYGYMAHAKADAETAWVELQTKEYHLLVADNNLPGLTGVGLLKKLRSACMPLPVIIAIGTMPPWTSAEYPLLLKATKLLKPYTFGDLLGMVKGILPDADCFRMTGLNHSPSHSRITSGGFGRQQVGTC